MGVHPAFTCYKALRIQVWARGDCMVKFLMERLRAHLPEDLVSDFPDGPAAREALGKVKFLIVQDMFMTETAKMANVVLPSASFVEKDGTFTNQEGRIQRLRRLHEPQGDVKADW
jgi:predicted molibdopterin-dependent oxidoreductase YjgC